MDFIRETIRSVMRLIAKLLNILSGGRLSPNVVTMVSLLAHVFIAWEIAFRHTLLAAVLLVIFGLFDTLDGELARLQKRASSAGMLLDASTDRFKEVMLYSGAAYNVIATTGRPYLAVWAVVACGASLSVSYVKAKGETAIKDANLSANQINRLFADGLMRFEVRMAILVLGLITNRVALALIVIAILAGFSAIGRLNRIFRKLPRVQN